MYLISIYFDDTTNRRIQQYINQVAKASGNTYMIDEKVPAHITLSAIDARNIEKVEHALEQMIYSWQQGILQWVSIGAFLLDSAHHHRQEAVTRGNAGRI